MKERVQLNNGSRGAPSPRRMPIAVVFGCSSRYILYSSSKSTSSKVGGREAGLATDIVFPEPTNLNPNQT